MRNHVQNRTLLIDSSRCPNLIDECEKWRFKRKVADSLDGPDTPVADHDHALAAPRYALANIRSLQRRGYYPGTDNHAASTPIPAAPGAHDDRPQTAAGMSPYRASVRWIEGHYAPTDQADHVSRELLGLRGQT